MSWCVIVYLQGHCVDLIFGLPRWSITSPHQITVRYGGCPVIVPKTYVGWTLSISHSSCKVMCLPDPPPFYTLSCIRTGTGDSPTHHSVLYPAVGWQSYPNSVIPIITIHKIMLVGIPEKAPQHPRIRITDPQSRVSPCVDRCGTQRVHVMHIPARARQGRRYLHQAWARERCKDSPTVSVISLIGYPANSRSLG